MTAELTPIGNGVNLLRICGVTLRTLDKVDSWLYAIDLPDVERKRACRQIMADGY